MVHPETLTKLGTQDTRRRQSKGCQCLWIVFVRCLLCPRFSVSLDCLRLVSCLPNVVIVFGLSSGTKDTGRRQSKDTDNFGQTRHQTKTIQRQWQHWADKTPDKDNPETMTTLGTQDTRQRQSKDTDNLGHTRHRMKTIQSNDNIGHTKHRTKIIQRHWQHWAHKTPDEDNPETLTKLGTQDTVRRQSRDTDSIGQTRHRTKTNKTKYTKLRTKRMNNGEPNTNREFPLSLLRLLSVLTVYMSNTRVSYEKQSRNCLPCLISFPVCVGVLVIPDFIPGLCLAPRYSSF
jgi:hypothetical protein